MIYFALAITDLDGTHLDISPTPAEWAEVRRAVQRRIRPAILPDETVHISINGPSLAVQITARRQVTPETTDHIVDATNMVVLIESVVAIWPAEFNQERQRRMASRFA